MSKTHRVRAVHFHVGREGDVDELGVVRDEAGDVVTIDDNVTVPPGTLGTVTGIDDNGTIHVRWDNGRNVGLIPDTDQWEVVE